MTRPLNCLLELPRRAMRTRLGRSAHIAKVCLLPILCPHVLSEKNNKWAIIAACFRRDTRAPATVLLIGTAWQSPGDAILRVGVAGGPSDPSRNYSYDLSPPNTSCQLYDGS